VEFDAEEKTFDRFLQLVDLLEDLLGRVEAFMSPRHRGMILRERDLTETGGHRWRVNDRVSCRVQLQVYL